MTATTTSVTEAVDVDYPEVEVPTAAEPFLPAAWARIEAYTAFRTSARAVEFIVEGSGTWSAPLRPFALGTAQKWNGTAWETVTVAPSPYGYCLDSGTYKINGTAGDDDADVPPLIIEAMRRLAEYLAAEPGKAGVSSDTVTAGSVTISTTRSASWMAKAIDNSGAGDLLRTYRRA